jgi:hypothetical protein
MCSVAALLSPVPRGSPLPLFGIPEQGSPRALQPSAAPHSLDLFARFVIAFGTDAPPKMLAAHPFTLAAMAVAASLLAYEEPALAIYFSLAWLFNAVAVTLSRPATVNSLDGAQALASSRSLLVVALFEGMLISAASVRCWLLIALFAVKLMADGILVHLLTPYSGGLLVLEQGDTTPPRWVNVHPHAWIIAVLLNVGGTCAHFEVATRRLPLLLEPRAVLSLVVLSAAMMWARVKKARGAWARRDAAWYAQPATQPNCVLLSTHQPTFSTYIVASDGTRLAADVWLPVEPGEASPQRHVPRPTVVHFTPYNRNWRVRANALGLRLLAKFGVTAPSRLFNTRSLRYLRALVPEVRLTLALTLLSRGSLTRRCASPSFLKPDASPTWLAHVQGFAFVSVDVRGTGASFGHRECDLLPREVADLVDAARWVRAQPWCDGWLASGGISYDGMCAMM